MAHSKPTAIVKPYNSVEDEKMSTLPHSYLFIDNNLTLEVYENEKRCLCPWIVLKYKDGNGRKPLTFTICSFWIWHTPRIRYALTGESTLGYTFYFGSDTFIASKKDQIVFKKKGGEELMKLTKYQYDTMIEFLEEIKEEISGFDHPGQRDFISCNFCSEDYDMW